MVSGDYDALIVRTAVAPAWRAEDEALLGLTPAMQKMFGAWVKAAGPLGVSVPGRAHSNGRPIGMQIVEPLKHGAIVLEIARGLENPEHDTYLAPELRARRFFIIIGSEALQVMIREYAVETRPLGCPACACTQDIQRHYSSAAHAFALCGWSSPCLPKVHLRREAVVGIVGSTNHRFRVLMVFRKV